MAAPGQGGTRLQNLMLYVPNTITILRLLAVPVTVWLVLEGRMAPAFWLFVAAGVSDAVDGLIARSFRARTRLGAYLDPVADKALLVGVFLALGYTDLLPGWLVGLVVLRDAVIIFGVWYLTMHLKERLAMQPLWVSKFNTVAQIALAILVLAVEGKGLESLDTYVPVAVGLVAVTTTYSLAAYVLRGLLILRTRETAG